MLCSFVTGRVLGLELSGPRRAGTVAGQTCLHHHPQFRRTKRSLPHIQGIGSSSLFLFGERCFAEQMRKAINQPTNTNQHQPTSTTRLINQPRPINWPHPAPTTQPSVRPAIRPSIQLDRVACHPPIAKVHLSNQHGKTNLDRRGFSDEECCDKRHLGRKTHGMGV